MVKPKFYWYIASPYTATGAVFPEDVRQGRYLAVMAFTAWAIKEKMIVYSPIIHCHEIASRYNLPTDADFWKEFDEKMVLAGGGVIVLCLEGWRKSKGVQMEIALAYANNLPVLFALIDDRGEYSLQANEPK